MGSKLLGNLALKNNSTQFDTFYISVAYARKSGVSQIQDALNLFRARGGRVKAIVGIDDGHTSKDGLIMLAESADELYIYHNNRPYQTFHPKLYAFEKKGQKAVVFVGSSNLTQGGLLSNYEVSTETHLDLTNNNEMKQFQEIEALIQHFSDEASPCCKKFDVQLLKRLEKEKLIESENAHDIKQLFRYKKELGPKKI